MIDEKSDDENGAGDRASEQEKERERERNEMRMRMKTAMSNPQISYGERDI